MKYATARKVPLPNTTNGRGCFGIGSCCVPLSLVEAAVAAEAQPLAENGTNQHGEGFTTSNPPPPTGNSQAYLLRRLARDAPEILERVKAISSPAAPIVPPR